MPYGPNSLIVTLLSIIHSKPARSVELIITSKSKVSFRKLALSYIPFRQRTCPPAQRGAQVPCLNDDYRGPVSKRPLTRKVRRWPGRVYARLELSTCRLFREHINLIRSSRPYLRSLTGVFKVIR